MTIIKSLSEINKIKNSVITIGNFDGIHKGHQTLIGKAISESKKLNCKSVVFTFANHPMNFFKPKTVKKLINNEDKRALLKETGVDVIIDVPFDKYMTQVSARDFIEDILVKKLGVKKIIVGHDFAFAKNKEGNINVLKELGKTYNFEVEVVEPIKINSIRISSTFIRTLLEEGKVDSVDQYLGRYYSMKGIVKKGKQIGRTINFPTANLEFDKDLIVPERGIYATKVIIENEIYFGATNIGYNPTVNGDSLSIETNILDFNEEIYGKIIEVIFLERIRDEKKFKSLEELKEQLKKDTNFVYKKYVYNKCVV